ncbi:MULTISPECIES: hypothetical protein [unclassified Streptomyces]|uniref:hypothetical protein n=1 Tax=unclassified Streptomyces TaxID=2593676 RepID=UPI00093C51DF|nr:hypothetical protein [Streptomyces sp. TSRI0281]OKI40112.1 hypothetical protein A6A29_40110 [Streptomyces sp. TSRI0281]
MHPPQLGEINPAIEMSLTAITGAWLLGFIIWVALQPRKNRPLYALLVGANFIATFQEPIVEVLNKVQFHPIELTVYDVAEFGRGEPLWVFLYLCAVPSTLGAMAIKLMHRPRAVRKLWVALAAIVLIEFVSEIVMAHFGAFKYYGSQPLEVLGAPIPWAFIYVTTYLGTGLILYHFDRNVSGIRRLAFLIMGASLMLGAEGFMGWPVFWGMVMELPLLPMALLGLLTVAISLGTFATLIKYTVPAERPRTGTATHQSTSPGKADLDVGHQVPSPPPPLP